MSDYMYSSSYGRIDMRERLPEAASPRSCSQAQDLVSRSAPSASPRLLSELMWRLSGNGNPIFAVYCIGLSSSGPKPGAAVDEAPSTEKEPPSDVEQDQHGQKRVRGFGQ